MKKSKTPARKFLAPMLRVAPRTGLALVAVAICLGGAGFLASKQTHPASAAGLSQIFCTYGTKNGVLCMNRYRGETGNNSAVVGYFNDFDGNENFQMQQLYYMCSGGFVTSTCPFTVGTGLNTRYQSDEIVQIKDMSTGLCVGNDVFDGSQTAEEKCNNVSGTGGGNGTIFIYNIAGGGGTQYYMESRYWSDQYRAPAWLCSSGYASDPRPFYTNSKVGYAGGCQWHYLKK